jgi:hypothetical protein
MSGKFAVDHDLFVAKNKSLARAYEADSRDKAAEKKGYSTLERAAEPSCFHCKHKPKCPEFRKKRTGTTTGAASFGGNERLYCDKFEPAPQEASRSMSHKQINSLLKNAMRKM